MTQEKEQQNESITEKILVCITIQHNSLRLIRKGAELAALTGGELHILHVEKGNNIFPQDNVSDLLKELFEYASELGGEVHIVCDEHVPERIANFIEDMDITQIVLGETMRSKLHRLIRKDIESYVTSATPEVEVMVLEREKKQKVNTRKPLKKKRVYQS